MFFAKPHSFVQQARLAITLALVAGYTNIITVLICGTVVSHVSGTTSYLGEYLAQGAWTLAGYAFFLLVTFFFGAVASAACTELGRRRGWDSIYVLPMGVEAMLLAMFTIGMEYVGQSGETGEVSMVLMTGLVSMAMGVQNATITRISNGVVRTTHVTGVVTDLGLESVQFLQWLFDRRQDIPPGSPRALLHGVRTHPSARRLALLGSIILSFAFGAFLGTIMHEHAWRISMFPPVLLLLWIIYQDISRPIAELEASDVRGQLVGIELPGALGVHHLRRNASGRRGTYRIPDLTEWSEKLPAEVRVVVLDLTDVSELDRDAILDLSAVISQLRLRGRDVVIAGLTHKQTGRLVRATRSFLPVENICPDFELAVARALNIAEDIEAESKNPL